MSQETLLEFYDEAVNTKAALDSAKSKHQNVFKRAEAAGINRAALSRVLKEGARDRDKREIDDRDFRRYMQWLGMPLGHQADLDLSGGGATAKPPNGHAPAPSEAEQQHVMRVAYAQGREAGRVGANIDSNPFPPGSEDAQLWSSAWHEGQRMAVEEQMGSPRGRRRRMAANGNGTAVAEAAEPEVPEAPLESGGEGEEEPLSSEP